MTRPILIIGAARSGTKMVRAAIAAHPGIAAVPYDINFVWKYGNYTLPHDELTAAHATDPVVQSIRRRVDAYRRREGADVVVEKTVSNALRVAFVRAVFPEARFVQVIRDGRDVAESARRMWQAPMDGRAVLEKAKAFPLRAIPTYALQYVSSYVRRRLRSDRRLATWGPRFEGIDELVRREPLLRVCAVQWRRCIEASEAQFAQVDPRDVITVRYEQLVASPEETLARVFDFLGMSFSPQVREHAKRHIEKGNVGKWRKRLQADEIELLSDELGPTLERLGYVEPWQAHTTG